MGSGSMTESDRLAVAALATTDRRERLAYLVASAIAAQPEGARDAIRASLLEHGTIIVRDGALIRVLTGDIEIMRTSSATFANLETNGTCAADV
jgi:hypothetical protein